MKIIIRMWWKWRIFVTGIWWIWKSIITFEVWCKKKRQKDEKICHFALLTFALDVLIDAILFDEFCCCSSMTGAMAIRSLLFVAWFLAELLGHTTKSLLPHLHLTLLFPYFLLIINWHFIILRILYYNRSGIWKNTKNIYNALVE